MLRRSSGLNRSIRHLLSNTTIKGFHFRFLFELLTRRDESIGLVGAALVFLFQCTFHWRNLSLAPSIERYCRKECAFSHCSVELCQLRTCVVIERYSLDRINFFQSQIRICAIELPRRFISLFEISNGIISFDFFFVFDGQSLDAALGWQLLWLCKNIVKLCGFRLKVLLILCRVKQNQISEM